MSKGINRRKANAFPASPTLNQEFHRDDLDMDCFYDGTRWLSTQLFTETFRWSPQPNYIVAQNTSQTFTTRWGAAYLQGGSDLWLINHRSQWVVALGGSPLSASHKWVGTLNKENFTLGTPVPIGGSTHDISGGTSGYLTTSDIGIAAAMNAASYPWLSMTWIKTGTPGDLHSLEEITFRIIV